MPLHDAPPLAQTTASVRRLLQAVHDRVLPGRIHVVVEFRNPPLAVLSVPVKPPALGRGFAECALLLSAQAGCPHEGELALKCHLRVVMGAGPAASVPDRLVAL